MDALRARLSSAYYAGPALGDALRLNQRLSQQGFATTVGYWPDATATPRVIADAYLACIDAVANQQLDSTISVKPMVMAFNADLIGELAERAGQVGIGLHYDSRAIEFADQTLELVLASAGQRASPGCTLPGAWHRSLRDAERLRELGVGVRVVKGMWRDPDHPDLNLREGYLAVIDRLCGSAGPVGVATHDAWLARQAVQRLLDAGTRCELEQLFGLPTRETLRVARHFSVPIRFYLPYGKSWIPYALSKALRRPRVLLWLMRDALFGHWSYVLK